MIFSGILILKMQFFFDFLDFQASGVNICAANFKKSQNKRLFANLKGKFSALAVKRIREKPKKRSTLLCISCLKDNCSEK
jgi:hypothetical protein